MQRNKFGEPRPSNFAEISEVFSETGKEPDYCHATIEHEKDNDGFGNKGWVAEIRENESGETVLTTLAYPEKDDLIADLKAIGISDLDFL